MDASAFPDSGPSVTITSVVSSNDAIDAACCSATRSTLVGSMMPATIMSTYSWVSASKPRVRGTVALTFSTITEPSSPAFSTICRIGSSRARRTMLTPVPSSPESLRLSSASAARSSATPPPGTIPSSTAARVALRASSTRAFFSFISVSVAAPTLMTATARELREPLLELLPVVVRGRFLDLRPDLLDAALDLLGVTGALDDRGVVLVHDHLLGAAEVVELEVLELDAEVFRDRLAAGQGRDVLEHRLAAIAEARRLDGTAGERPAQLVHHQGRQGLALEVLGDDEQRLAGPGDLLEQRQHVLHHAELLLVDEDDGVLQYHVHPLRIRHEVGREVAPVELHALDHLEGGLHRLGFFDGDDAILADLLHGFGDQVADRLVVVGGDRGDLGDLLLILGGLGHMLQLLDHHVDRLLDTPLQGHRVRARGHVLETPAEDRLGENGGRGRPVARHVRGLGGDLLDHLSPQVLAGVLQLDFLGDGHTVLGDGRAPELLVDDDVPPLRPERDLDGMRHDVDPAQERRAGSLVEQKLLSHGYVPPECV